jgi:phosphatidyl-myo-inositol alpha-mannosyltransferase
MSVAHWVLLGCPYSLSVPGGVQGQVVALAAALRARGHLVTVVAPDDDAAPWSGWSDPPVGGPGDLDCTLSLGPSTGVRANGSIAPVSLSPTAALHVRRFLHTHRPDVVHLHEPLAPLAGFGVLHQRVAPLVGTFHRSGTPRGAGALRPLASWALGRMTVRCAVSQAAADTAAALCGGSYDILFNGVDLARYDEATPWPVEGPTVLFVGRAEERKGLAVLLEAFCGLQEPATLWICSDGPQRLALEARYPESDRVRWLGRLDDATLARRLAGAHIACAPSISGESFGLVVLEALAARCALVATSLPGYVEAAGGHGRLVPPGDAVALRAALRGALADLATATGSAAPGALEAAHAHAAARSLDALAARYEDAYARAEETWAPARPAGHRSRRKAPRW